MYKQPITDLAKKSKKGLLSLEIDDNGAFITREEGRGSCEKVGCASSEKIDSVYRRAHILHAKMPLMYPRYIPVLYWLEILQTIIKSFEGWLGWGYNLFIISINIISS